VTFPQRDSASMGESGMTDFLGQRKRKENREWLRVKDQEWGKREVEPGALASMWR